MGVTFDRLSLWHSHKGALEEGSQEDKADK